MFTAIPSAAYGLIDAYDAARTPEATAAAWLAICDYAGVPVELVPDWMCEKRLERALPLDIEDGDVQFSGGSW